MKVGLSSARTTRTTRAAGTTRAAITCGLAVTVASLTGTRPVSGDAARPAPTAPTTWRTDAACQSCHTDAARTWAASLHHRSASNAAYTRAVRLEPLPFCRKCHAPHGDPTRETVEPALSLGITCTDCHVRPGTGAVIAAPHAHDDAADAENAPHPVVRDASLRTASCGRCHEFDFPDGRGTKMQRTMTEHAASSFAKVDCSACHMPRGANGARDHTFHVSRNASFLARAVKVEARREGTRAVFVLEPVGVGHAFPTGDLFRRLTLTVRGDTTVRRYFTRRFGAEAKPSSELARQAGLHPLDAAHPRRELDDTRLQGRTEITVDLGRASERLPVTWQLDYERVDAVPTARPEDAVLDGSERLASGTLPPAR